MFDILYIPVYSYALMHLDYSWYIFQCCHSRRRIIQKPCVFLCTETCFSKIEIFSWLTHFIQGLQLWGFSVPTSVSFNITSLDENQWSISLTPENWGPLLIIWGEGRRYSRYGHPIHFPTVLLSFVSCLSMALCFPAFFFLFSFPWHPWQLPRAKRRGCKTHMQMKFWI